MSNADSTSVRGEPPTSLGSNGPPAPPPDVQQLVAAPKRRHPLIILAAMVLLVFITAATTSFFVTGGGHEATNDSYVEARVVRISPKVSGQVISLRVDDNDAVKAGDLLLEIDPVDYQAKVDQAIAAVAASESAVEQAKAAVLRAEANVGEAQAAARAAATEAIRRASDYRRYAAMGTDGVSAQQVETGKHAMDAATDQKDAAEKKAVAAAAELNVAKTNIGTAEAQVSAAKAQLRFAQLQLQYTKVFAPESGNITKRNVESGDFVSPGQPLLAIVRPERWVVANFKEVQLHHMRIGQPVEVTVDSFPNKPLRGRVQSLQSGTGSRFELLPPENATGNWVKVVQRLPVKIVLEPDQPAVKRLEPGMSAEVSVDTRTTSAPSGGVERSAGSAKAEAK